jgi:PAS domain S-box-containing protein
VRSLAEKGPQQIDLPPLEEVSPLRAVIDSIPADCKQPEEKIEAGRYRFYSVLEDLPAVVSLRDRDLRMVYTNRRFREVFGDPAGKRCHEALKGLAVPCENCKLLEVFEGSSVRTWEYSHASRGMTFQMYGYPFVDADGTGFVLALGIDISDRKRAEEQLQRSEERYRVLVENANEAIIVVQDGLLRFANSKASRLTGYRRLDEVPERKFAFLIHPEDLEKVLRMHRERMEGNREQASYQFRILHKDGRERWLQMNSAFLSWEGRPASLCCLTDITEQKQTQEVLEAERARFLTVLEELPGFVYVRGADFSIRFANRYFRETFGDPGGKRCYEIATGRPSPCKVCHAIDRGQDRRVRHWEFSHRPKGRTFQMYAYPFRDADGSEAVLVLGIDITARKKAEEDLKVSEERYHALVKNANEGIFVVQDGLFRFGNRRAAEMAGYTRAELSGVNFLDLVHPDDRDTVARKYLESLHGTSEAQVYAFRVLHKAGGVRWFEMRATSILWEGRPATLCFISDVTERRKAEDRAFLQSALLEGINKVFRETLSCDTEEEVARKCLDVALELTQSEFGFLGQMDTEGKLTVVAMSDPGWEACRMPKPTAVNLLEDRKPRGIWGEVWRTGEAVIANDPARHPARVGLPAGHPELRAFLGVPMKERGRVGGMLGLANKASRYTAEDREIAESLCVAVQEAMWGKRAEIELRKHKEHLEALVEVRTRELRAVNEDLRRGIEKQRQAEEEVRKLNEELEERVRQRTRDLEEAYERLKELDKMKDAFLSSVSHELRTPLTSIRSFSEILLRYGDLDPENGREFLGIINSEAERLTRLINDLLDLSRIEAGGMVWQDSVFSLEEVIRDAARASGGLLEEKSLGLVLEIEADLPPVFADRDRIQQVLTNLLSNAVKFSWKGGEIRVRAASFAGRREGDPGRWIRVSVSDNGIGIDEKDQEIIFDKFRQGSHDSLGEKPKGTGLGLPICKEVITHYGGSLTVESRKGRGSTFTFTLSAAGVSKAGSAPPADRNPHHAS